MVQAPRTCRSSAPGAFIHVGKPARIFYFTTLDMTTMSLRRTSSSSTNEELDVRVEDYLNDKLQTYTDLENLDSLLAKVIEQQALLRNQVC